jgi:hypothetical protein
MSAYIQGTDRCSGCREVLNESRFSTYKNGNKYKRCIECRDKATEKEAARINKLLGNDITEVSCKHTKHSLNCLACADKFRMNMPFIIEINRTTVKYYEINRKHEYIGYNGAKSIEEIKGKYVGEYWERVYIYSDGCAPFRKTEYMNQYNKKLHDIAFGLTKNCLTQTKRIERELQLSFFPLPSLPPRAPVMNACACYINHENHSSTIQLLMTDRRTHSTTV